MSRWGDLQTVAVRGMSTLDLYKYLDDLREPQDELVLTADRAVGCLDAHRSPQNANEVGKNWESDETIYIFNYDG
jgi:hypothetical protein